MRKYARIIIAAFALSFAVFVALQFKPRAPAARPPAAIRTDPGAVVESTGGDTQRFRSSREDVRVQYQKLLTYADGSSKLEGVTIRTEDRGGAGRRFVVTAREGKLEQNESVLTLDGDVRLESSDGMVATTDHATYTGSDGIVSAAGPARFERGRLAGTGVGFRYEKQPDILTILDQAVVHVAPDDEGGGGADVTAGTAAFARRDKYIQFDRSVRIERRGETIDAEAATARLTADDKRIESLELHRNARISAKSPAPGALQSLVGSDMTLTYGPDGQALQRVVIVGDANLQIAADRGTAGRRIAARTLDITLAPDGTTPVALVGRDAVQLTFPADAGAPARTIRAPALDASGEPGRGLTRAVFSGGVEFREGGPQERAAGSATLEVAMKPNTGEIDTAHFVKGARFEEGALSAQAASAQYDLAKGTLQLTGSEPERPVPRVVNERIAVDATAIDITLEGPRVDASGSVKSTLQPSKPGAGATSGSAAKMPSMLKQDEPVTVLGDKLAYDGKAATAIYTGAARLFQSDTTIKGDKLSIDQNRGDLTATGHAMTTTMREQEDANKKKTRVRSTGTADDLKYEDASRRLTYTGQAHLVGPEGDLTATRIQLYLKPSGDELDHAEAFAEGEEKLTLREQNRTTTGAHMTYSADRETYVITGLPATVLDECGRETTGRTLTWVKSTDTIVVDGNQQIRTRTKGGTGKCQ